MAAQRQDEKLDFMKKKLSKTTGVLPDSERTYYKGITSSSSNELYQLKQQWVKSLGQTGNNVIDEWFKYLRAQGYKGTVQDMERMYFYVNS